MRRPARLRVYKRHSSCGLELTVRNETGGPLPPRVFTPVASRAAKVLQLPRRSVVGVALVRPGRVQALNRRYRGRDYPTDVLAFPLGPRLLRRGPDGLVYLGDIVLSLKEPASRTRTAELRFLFAHALLHLCGYDHGTARDAFRMEARTEALLGRARRVARRGLFPAG